MAPFARDLGYLDEAGEVKPPFRWDEDRRLRLRAKLDAVFFHLYGVTDRDEVRYIYSTFPIVERQETEAYWTVPLLRPLPRLDQRAVSRPPGRGDRVGSDADKVALAAVIPTRARDTIHDKSNCP